MARYIDADIEVSDYVTVWDCDCSEFGRQTVMSVDDLQYLPTADVVPKSELEILQHLLKDAWKRIEEFDELCGELQKAKAEVASEIFAEIEKYLLFNAYDIALISHKTFDALKKKYTGGNDDRL